MRSNIHGQVKTKKYENAAGIETWTGYDSVTHQPMSMVVQQHKRVYAPKGPSSQVTATLTDQYDEVGKLFAHRRQPGR